MRRSLAATGIAALALAAGSLVIGPADAAPKPSSATTANGTFTCRASLVRSEGTPGGLLDTEPVVANRDNPTCQAEDASLIDVLNPLTIPNLATVRALYAQTNVDPTSSAEARSGAATADVTLPDGTVVHAEALTSQASATCVNGKPALAGSSHVLYLTVGGSTVVDVSDPQTIAIPGVATIYLNQQTINASKDQVTQRALRVESALGTVTVAESQADFHGSPCTTGGGGGGGGGNHPPQCSDERDNDGDGLIDYPNDPGCASPQDDDETNNTPPQCSDGQDNDGDGFVDYPSDPGCTDRNDNDETDNDDPECSDGVDNDGDGRIDFPADTGCTSGSDDDEAAGFLTGGGGYDETDKKIANEDYVNPGSSLRFGEVLPCDLGQNPSPNLTVSWHTPKLLGQVKLDSLTRAFCRNDPFISPGRPLAEFDTYVGAGTGTYRDAATGVRSGVTLAFISIDRGEPGAPPVTGVDFFQIEVRDATTHVLIASGVGTLDEGNVQAHTPGSFKESKANNA
jgi:hypothetical protein